MLILVTVWVSRFEKKSDIFISLSLSFCIMLFFFYKTFIFLEPLVPFDSLRGSKPFDSLPPLDPHTNFQLSDVVTMLLPLYSEVKSAILNGDFPLFSDILGTGHCLACDPQAQVFSPLTWFALPLDSVATQNFFVITKITLAVFFTFLFLRSLGLSVAASIFGAKVWGASGFTQQWIAFPLGNFSYSLPFSLYGISKMGSSSSLPVFALYTLLTSGHPEAVVWSLVVIGTFYLLWYQNKDKKDLLLVFAAFFLAAPALLMPFTSFRNSWRAETLKATVEHLENNPPPRLQRLAQILFPNAWGNTRFYMSYYGENNSLEDSSGFVGTPSFMLSICALYVLGKTALPWFVPIAMGFSVLSFPIEYISLPPALVTFITKRRSYLIISFSLTVLASLVLDKIRNFKSILYPFSLTLLLLFGIYSYSPSTETILPFKKGYFKLQLMVLVTFFLGFAFYLLFIYKWVRKGIFLCAMSVIAFFELYKHHKDNYPSDFPYSTLPSSPVINKLSSVAKGYRISGVDTVFIPSVAALYRLNDIRFYNPLVNKFHFGLFYPFILSEEGPPFLDGESISLLPYWGVKFLVTPPRYSVPGDWKLQYKGYDCWIYSHSRPRPIFGFQNRDGLIQLQPFKERNGYWEFMLPKKEGDFFAILVNDGGWKAYVDGKRVKVQASKTPEVKIRVKEEDKRLVIKYSPDLLMVSAVVHMIGWIFYFIHIFLRRR